MDVNLNQLDYKIPWIVVELSSWNTRAHTHTSLCGLTVKINLVYIQLWAHEQKQIACYSLDYIVGIVEKDSAACCLSEYSICVNEFNWFAVVECLKNSCILFTIVHFGRVESSVEHPFLCKNPKNEDTNMSKRDWLEHSVVHLKCWTIDLIWFDLTIICQSSWSVRKTPKRGRGVRNACARVCVSMS